MMHQLMIRLAQMGGECAFWLLLAISIVSSGIISNRVWFLFKYRIDVEEFARALLQHLRTGDWAKARAVANRSAASACMVVAGGLTQIDDGPRAVRRAMRSVRLLERIRLEGHVGVLARLGYTAVLIGLLGTVCDVIAWDASPSPEATSITTQAATFPFATLAPTAAGLAIAAPALLASTLLKNRVRHRLRLTDWVTQLVLLQLGSLHLPAMTRNSRRQSPAA